MELEQETRAIPADENLDQEIMKLVAEGWMLVPGTKPVVIYQLVREKRNALGGFGSMIVDDSKVHILHADGTLD